MKAVLISIKPKWCKLIADGKKTMEVRKTKPKLQVPFKCYIYCTQNELLTKSHHNGMLYVASNKKYKTSLEMNGNLSFSGKVIGEFICDEIITDKTLGHDAMLMTAACLSPADAAAYCTKQTYGWHISNLVIYNKPKELSEFRHCGVNYHYNPIVSKPPQSWCYVEELEEEK